MKNDDVVAEKWTWTSDGSSESGTCLLLRIDTSPSLARVCSASRALPLFQHHPVHVVPTARPCARDARRWTCMRQVHVQPALFTNCFWFYSCPCHGRSLQAQDGLRITCPHPPSSGELGKRRRLAFMAEHATCPANDMECSDFALPHPSQAACVGLQQAHVFPAKASCRSTIACSCTP
ncbi:hypothetical protein BDU57DRAFT_523540 [Ampelomyces quisqualis]|uniref:Uncharacterized protein n=1 Tax=Ampelomyces quisqualis TaxID=50730 RepID=A0A6A5Q920_AMPQU|nr:hypothetical protein BDU57DRAFT_523540 [Ampelomyces quisqualis]